MASFELTDTAVASSQVKLSQPLDGGGFVAVLSVFTETFEARDLLVIYRPDPLGQMVKIGADVDVTTSLGDNPVIVEGEDGEFFLVSELLFLQGGEIVSGLGGVRFDADGNSLGRFGPIPGSVDELMLPVEVENGPLGPTTEVAYVRFSDGQSSVLGLKAQDGALVLEEIDAKAGGGFGRHLYFDEGSIHHFEELDDGRLATSKSDDPIVWNLPDENTTTLLAVGNRLLAVQSVGSGSPDNVENRLKLFDPGSDIPTVSVLTTSGAGQALSIDFDEAVEIDGVGFAVATETLSSVGTTSKLAIDVYDLDGDLLKTFSIPDVVGEPGFLDLHLQALEDDGAIRLLASWGGIDEEAKAEVLEVVRRLDLTGTAEEDRMRGLALADRLDGFDDDDSLAGAGGDDVLEGGDGDDVLGGDEGDDLIQGEAGDDTIVENSGDDQIFGGDGDDVVVDFSGENDIFGGDGDDKIAGGTGIDRLAGDEGDDILNGDDGKDELVGDLGADKLRGGDGNDVMDGGFGNDVLRGDAGRDSITAGGGEDRMTGGDGRDTFIIRKARTVDVTITDFSPDSEKIRLGGFRANDFGDLRIEDVGSGLVVTDRFGQFTLTLEGVGRVDANDILF